MAIVMAIFVPIVDLWSPGWNFQLRMLLCLLSAVILLLFHIKGTRVKLKWTPGNKNSSATSGHDGVTCSRHGSVGAFCM